MSQPIKSIMLTNKYIILEMLKSNQKINYDCFYKRDIEHMLEVLREEYKRLLKNENKEEI